MKTWSKLMIFVVSLFSTISFFSNASEAASVPSMTVTTTSDVVSATYVGYTFTFNPVTPISSSNRIVLSTGFLFPKSDLNAITISDGVTTVHPAFIGMDGATYIEVNPPAALSGTVTIRFDPSYGIENPSTPGAYKFGLSTDYDYPSFQNVSISVGTSTLLQSLSIDNATVSQTASNAYNTVISSTYNTLILHATTVDPTATVSVYGATYWNSGIGSLGVDISNTNNFQLNVTTTGNMTVEYPITITRQYDIPNVYFNNTSNTISTVSGTFFWGPPYGYLPTGSFYQIGFFDDSNNVVSTVSTAVYSNLSYTLPNTPVPSSATRIGVLLMDANSSILAKKSVPIWYNSNMPVQFVFKDLNTTGGMIDGQLSWNKGQDESQITQYQILYRTRNDSGSFHLLDTVAKNSTGSYQYHLQNIPTDAVDFLLGLVNDHGEVAPFYPTISIYDDRSADPIKETIPNTSLPAATDLNISIYSTAAGTSGQIIWSVPSVPQEAASSIYAYNLYYTDVNGSKMRPIGSILNDGNMTTMTYNISSLTIPSGAINIAVYAVGADGSESTMPASAPINMTDLNGDGHIDVSDLVQALKHSVNVSAYTVNRLLWQIPTKIVPSYYGQ